MLQIDTINLHLISAFPQFCVWYEHFEMSKFQNEHFSKNFQDPNHGIMVREHTGLQGMYLEHIAFYVKIAQLVASGDGCSSKDKQ